MKTKNHLSQLKQLLIILLVLAAIISCKKTNDDNETPDDVETVTDIDGNVYETAIVDTQVWLKENLKVTHYNNGDAIDNITSYTDWKNLTSGAYCIYGNKVGNIDSTLYNWYAVVDDRNICPEGWHVPSDAEWKILEGNSDVLYGVGSSEWDKWDLRGSDAGLNLKSPNGWLSSGNIKSLYGISIPPNGIRYMEDGLDFYDHGYSAWIWTSTDGDNDFIAISRYLGSSHDKIGRMESLKKSGLSVRCVKN